MKLGTMFVAAAFAVSFAGSGLAEQVKYSVELSGAAESPPVASPGLGTGLVTVDSDLGTMRVEASFSGLLGNVTAAHIHCCTDVPLQGTIGVATPTPTFPGFPAGVTAGTYDMTFDLNEAASYNGSFVTANGDVTGAKNALLGGFDAGQAYLNIHSSSFGGGEIRGFLQVVPEPSTCSLFLMGLAVPALFGRSPRRARQSPTDFLR